MYNIDVETLEETHFFKYNMYENWKGWLLSINLLNKLGLYNLAEQFKLKKTHCLFL